VTIDYGHAFGMVEAKRKEDRMMKVRWTGTTLQVTAVMAGAALLATLGAGDALAVEGLSGHSAHIETEMGGALKIAGAVATVAGVIMGVVGAMKLKNMANDRAGPGDGAVQTIMTLVAAAALIVVPQLLGIGVGTLFGSDGNTSAQVESIDSVLN
jgi:hypothetical protein